MFNFSCTACLSYMGIHVPDAVGKSVPHIMSRAADCRFPWKQRSYDGLSSYYPLKDASSS
jgi:hypothetical protein